MSIRGSKLAVSLTALLLLIIYSLTAPANHSEAEDVYDFALRVEQGTFTEQTGVNRLLALPMFGIVYDAAQSVGYMGRAFPFMIFLNRLLAVGCVLLFWRILRANAAFQSEGIGANGPPNSSGVTALGHNKPQTSHFQLPAALLLAFSYGFWRYANEAETYMLAAFFLLVTWCLAENSFHSTNAVVKRLSFVFCPLIAALGILVHLLNLIPLLLAIPLYYLLSKEWKKAVLHGVVTGALVAVAYGACFYLLDWNELGAQHHAAESGFSLINLLRSVAAVGQCLVSGNFLFGFESFRNTLVDLFPSRMLGEEFYMARQMPGWIRWAGMGTVSLFAGWSLWVGVSVLLNYRKHYVRRKVSTTVCKPQTANRKPLTIAILVWLLLYVIAVMRTESGSPELWILGLIPLWLLAERFLHGPRMITLVVLLFAHNLVAGLLPVMPARSDYHAAKSRWLVENSTKDDVILTSYEPILIFYLNYYAEAEVVNSGNASLGEIQERLGNGEGEAYALSCFFSPLESMKVRDPAGYEKMKTAGEVLHPRFEQIVENEFSGIYELRREAE